MTRPGGRVIVATFAVAVLGGCVLPVARAGLSGTSRSATAAPARPNIVFILADDLDYQSFQDETDLPAMHTLLTQAGAAFTNYNVSDSLCCPARASMLRGQYVHNHGVQSNSPPNGGYARWEQLHRDDSTIGTWLHAAGYRTGMFGKYLNGYPAAGAATPLTYVPPGWDDWAAPLLQDGYAEFNYRMNENGIVNTYGNDPSDYLVDALANRATNFIDSEPPGQPFFMEVAPFVPHEPAVPAPRYADALPGLTAPRTASFDQANVASEPKWLRTLAHLSAGEQQWIDHLYRLRMQTMLGVGDLVQSIVDALTSTGQLDNTYIVFSSDNGFHLGQHRMPWGKESAYDEDVHVPLVVRGPGIAPGTVIPAMTREIDLAPTFAALAGVTPPSFVDGVSFAPLLTGATSVPGAPKDALIEHYFNASTSVSHAPDGSLVGDPDSESFPWGVTRPGGADPPTIVQPVIPPYQALRTARYLYVEYNTGERQLYDVVRDPSELRNVAALRPTLVATLHTRLVHLVHCAAASCRT